MKHGKILPAAGLLLGLNTFTVQAALTPYTSAGQNLVYSSVSNLTWTGDANLLGTMMADEGHYNLVNAIIAASPVITDTPNNLDTPAVSGQYEITEFDFNDFYNSGTTTWWGAKAFVNYLNSINYAGSNQWVLPSAGVNPISQVGYNPTGTQFGQLFYNEMGANAGDLFPDTNNFINEQNSGYWLNSEYTQEPINGWRFETGGGAQSYGDKSARAYAWAVTSGTITAVPVPAALWLFGTGLLGMLGFKRRKQA